MAHAAKTIGFERKSFRTTDQKLITRYVYGDWNPEDLIEVRQRWGMFQKGDSEIQLVESENTLDNTYDNLISLL